MPLPTRIGRLRPPVLCLIVSRAAAKDGDVEKLVTEAVAGGVAMVQLRERELPAAAVVALGRRLKPVTRGKALLIINDRVDVAIAVEADGVQLPEDGLPIQAARSLIGKHAVLGRSVHSLEAAQLAATEGAEFVIAGTIFKSPTHPDAKPVGVGLVSEITSGNSQPVLAVGGVTAAKAGELIKAGAAGVAVISAVAGAADPKAAATELKQALQEAWAEHVSTVAAVT